MRSSPSSGIPSVGEDDAIRAVTAAETMRGSMAELNAELADRWGVEIQTRAGVNTGEVVVGSEVTVDGMVMGDVANVAARLQAAVGPGEIVVSGTTAQLVRSSVELEQIEPLTVKGKRDPVIAFRVVGLLAPEARRSLSSPFVGRTAELEILEAELARAVVDRSCRLALVAGRSGYRQVSARFRVRDTPRVERNRASSAMSGAGRGSDHASVRGTRANVGGDRAGRRSAGGQGQARSARRADRRRPKHRGRARFPPRSGRRDPVRSRTSSAASGRCSSRLLSRRTRSSSSTTSIAQTPRPRMRSSTCCEPLEASRYSSSGRDGLSSSRADQRSAEKLEDVVPSPAGQQTWHKSSSGGW